MKKSSKIYIAGHTGMVGSAIHRYLIYQGYTNFVFTPHSKFDLTSQQVVFDFFEREKPDYVFLCAAKVGGILANNTYRGEFIYDNLMIEANIIHAAYKNGVKKLLNLGSSCIFPSNCPQPIKEEYLLTGPLEHTNEPYAIAKIAGIKMCESYNKQYGTNFTSVMPTNLYGYKDNYHEQNSHVLPALIRRFHEAKLNNDSTVTIWGTGAPMREFMHADDLAEACCFLMDNYDMNEIVNIGTGTDISIKDLAELVKSIVEFEGDIIFDNTKPDGTFRKLLDVSRLKHIGYEYKISLECGIKSVYKEFCDNYEKYIKK